MLLSANRVFSGLQMGGYPRDDHCGGRVANPNNADSPHELEVKVKRRFPQLSVNSWASESSSH